MENNNTTDLKVFENSEFGELDVIIIDGAPWFPATDCAKKLGYSRPADAITAHCKGSAKHRVLTKGGEQLMKYIPEGDLYRLITQSKLLRAKRFERWVFDEVLPTIRKTGSYATTPPPAATPAAEPDLLKPWLWRGEPVATLKDIARYSGREKWRWSKIAMDISRANPESSGIRLLTSRELYDFKLANPGVANKSVQCLYVLNEQGLRAVFDRAEWMATNTSAIAPPTIAPAMRPAPVPPVVPHAPETKEVPPVADASAEEKFREAVKFLNTALEMYTNTHVPSNKAECQGMLRQLSTRVAVLSCSL